MSYSRKIVLGAGISAALLVVFLATVDLGHMLDAMAGANYAYAVPGVALYLFSVLFRTFRWQVLLRHLRPLSTGRLYPVVVVGYMANNLLPMRLGELARSYYIGEREGISKTAALATILVERVLDALTLLFFVAVIAVFVPLSGVAEGFGRLFGVPWVLLAVVSSVPFIGAFCMLMLFALYPRAGRAAARPLVSKLPRSLGERVSGMVDTFLSGLSPLSDLRTLALLLLLSVPIWLLEASLFLMVALSFGVHELFDGFVDLAISQVLITAIANIGSSIPAAPGGIGIFELVTREALLFMQTTVDRATAGGYAAVIHLLLILPVVILGQIFLWLENLSLRRLSEGAEEAEAESVTIRREAGEAGP